MTRVAVVGVGSMGKNHVRVYHDMPEADLVAVVDANPLLGESISEQYQVPYYQSCEAMLEDQHPEAITVAVPTNAHYAVASQLLEAGCHILVEKPIASTLVEARQLILTAEKYKRLLMVGHIERYNPAVIELKRRLDAGELGRVFQIHARRLGPFPSRIQDVGVVMDLATHDLDIMRYLTGSKAVRVFAEVNRELHTSHEDMFVGVVRFANSAVGVLEINWLTPAKIRELYVTGERGMFIVNYLTQDLSFYENGAMHDSSPLGVHLLKGVSEGKVTHYPINKKEPLRAELESFIACINNCEKPAITGEDAEAALELAGAMVESAYTAQVWEFSQSDLLGATAR